MKIAFYAYRDWAFNVFKEIKTDEKILFSTNNYAALESYDPNVVFFVGWSEIVPKKIVEKYKCLCIHPSNLPKYRGGSPIQNQIMDGVTSSAVSLFQMDEQLDHGSLYMQTYLDLSGSLDEIFDMITKNSIDMINEYVCVGLDPYKQNHKEATYCKRRTPEMSEITPEELDNSTAEQIYNKVRCLQKPYPNAFLRCKGGEKIYLTNGNNSVNIFDIQPTHLIKFYNETNDL